MKKLEIKNDWYEVNGERWHTTCADFTLHAQLQMNHTIFNRELMINREKYFIKLRPPYHAGIVLFLS